MPTLSSLPPFVQLGADVERALRAGRPVVALESAVVTHGLPHPANLHLVPDMQQAIINTGAAPAVCLVHRGSLWIGADMAQIEEAVRDPTVRKAGAREIGASIASGAPAGLTVSGTLAACALCGIQVLATGGIGGVHRDAAASGDISADLHQLAGSGVVTVCSGVKSVLDVPRTLEYLETLSIPTFVYDAAAFPAFYLRSSGIPAETILRVDDIARVFTLQRDLGYKGGTLVANPLSEDQAIPEKEWDVWMERALKEAEENGVRGKDVTPFLLAAVARLSGGRTVQANLDLLLANARLASRIAVAIAS